MKFRIFASAFVLVILVVLYALFSGGNSTPATTEQIVVESN